jgi:preprotein translocase subunit SecG
MLYQLLVALLVFVCLLLLIVILIQQGKGSIGFGNFGGAQMLFGGSGGQDIFQKITWTLGSIFMIGSLGIFFLGAKKEDFSGFFGKRNFQKTVTQKPVLPASQDVAKTEKQADVPVSQPEQNTAATQEKTN